MPRAIWNGSISFGLVNIPIKLYNAVSRKNVSFHQIDANTGARIKMQRVSAKTGEEVPYEQIVKGYELSPDRYVLVEPQELDALDPESSHTIDIEEFVDLADIDPIFFDAAYYVAPGKAAEKPYALLGQGHGGAGQGRAGPVRHAHEAVPGRRAGQGGHAPALHHGLRRRGGAARAAARARVGRRREGERQRGGHGRPADRLALRRLRARALQGHLPGAGARPDRAQGGRRGDRDRGGAGAGRNQVVDLMAALEASVADAREARKRHPTAVAAVDEDDEDESPKATTSTKAKAKKATKKRAAPAKRAKKTRALVGGRRRGPHALGLQPRQGPLPGGPLHQGRGPRLLRPHRPGAPAPPRRPRRDAPALPQRPRRQVVLREELPPPPARVGAARRRCRARTAIIEFCRIDSVAALMWVANLAALELHTSMARVDDPDAPTMVVFDLDPGAPAALLECAEVALLHPPRARAPRPRVRGQDLGLEGAAGLPAAQHADHVRPHRGVQPHAWPRPSSRRSPGRW